jgi:uncharacterized protein (DUF2126 family)
MDINQALQPEQPRQIEITGAPAPLQMDVAAVVQTDAGPRVVVFAESVNGRFAFFLSPEHGEQFGTNLVMQSRAAKTGLVLPPGAVPPPADMLGH